jgi:hypothetical protein
MAAGGGGGKGTSSGVARVRVISFGGMLECVGRCAMVSSAARREWTVRETVQVECTACDRATVQPCRCLNR